MQKNKTLTIKCITIAILVAYLILCCFPCYEALSKFRGEDGLVQFLVIEEADLFSVYPAVMVALQILFLFLNRPFLQLVAGWSVVSYTAIFPVIVNMLADLTRNIQYFMEPAGPTVDAYAMTGVGWAVAGISWVLIVLDVVLAVMLYRQKIQQEEQTEDTIGE